MKKFLSVVTIVTVLTLGCGYASAGTYLVYDPGGTQNNVAAAMTSLGYTFDTRTSSNPVTSGDLTSGSYEALVIGWSVGGNYGGLTAVASAGIAGNAVITGHDADYHTYAGVAAAATVMDRMVQFAGAATGTGILAFTEWTTSPFSYLPAAWGITAMGSLSGEIVTGITAAGAASGFYAGLTTANLSNWGESFHAYFTGYNSSMFEPFELGAYGDARDKVITIGTTVTPLPTPEPLSLLLLGFGILGLAGVRRFRK